ncbi:MAG: hypothetical protein A2Y97_01780, partial [Nitrospirae bacterium RBG_13_39_12]
MPARRFALKRAQKYLIIIMTLSVFMGCTPQAIVQTPPEKASTLALADISEGLPRDGQWRENMALADMDGDGFLDIVAPPPRAAENGKNMPHIFLRDRKEGRWKEGAFAFPSLKDYGYGGIAVGDINRDGYSDIALAVHEGRVIVLESDKSHGFVEMPFHVKDLFHSRMVLVSDINGDVRPDIIALSEAPFSPPRNRPKGILIGLNRDGSDWDVKALEGSGLLFGDSLAGGDINGDGNKDIIIAPLVDKVNAKFIWFGDGKGNFKAYDGNLMTGDVMAFSARAGDLDGDGKDEAVFRVSGIGHDAKIFLSAYKWTGDGFADISRGLELIEDTIVFDLADTDGDGKKELIVLTTGGIFIYKYTDRGWEGIGYYRLSLAETAGAFDL